MKAVIGVGTNVGDRLQNIRDAKKAFGLVPETKVTEVSFVYETEPWGMDTKTWFVNAVVEVKTKYTPQELLKACQRIETQLGRDRNLFR